MRLTNVIIVLTMALLCHHTPSVAADNDSTNWKNLPLDELYRQADYDLMLSGQLDSANMILTHICRYNKHNMQGLNAAERKIVALSYYRKAMIEGYALIDYNKCIHTLINGMELCEDDTLRFRMDQVLEVVLVGYATVIPTDENRQLAHEMATANFKTANRLNLEDDINAGYFNLFPFGIGKQWRKQNRWATDIMIRREYNVNIFAIYGHFFSKAIDQADHGNYDKALVNLRRMMSYIPKDIDPHVALAAYMSMSQLFQESGRQDSALIYAKRYEALAAKYNLADALVNIYERYVSYYTAMGDQARADHYNMLSVHTRDSIIRNSGFDKLFKSNIVAKLGNVNDEDHDQQQAATHWPYYALATVLLLFTAAGTLLWRKRHRRRQLPEPAEQQQQQVQQQTLQEQTQPEQEPARQEENVKYRNSQLSEKKKDAIFARIQDVMSDMDNICNPDFSLGRLVELCNTNQKYVSQVINERSGKNFGTLLATYRVEEACRRMSDAEHYGNMTLEGIAESVGFKNRFTFINAFKRVKGVVPTEYAASMTN